MSWYCYTGYGNMYIIIKSCASSKYVHKSWIQYILITVICMIKCTNVAEAPRWSRNRNVSYLNLHLLLSTSSNFAVGLDSILPSLYHAIMPSSPDLSSETNSCTLQILLNSVFIIRQTSTVPVPENFSVLLLVELVWLQRFYRSWHKFFPFPCFLFQTFWNFVPIFPRSAAKKRRKIFRPPLSITITIFMRNCVFEDEKTEVINIL